ncbi:MAG TPA: hypothetical protein VGE27_05145, partial [Gemmatimonas sp.]|uniref:hypothetical protein n=1 Tax=Gemmatimonas sp. TaxID=1962908 RepID=UPI002ED9DD1C
HDPAIAVTWPTDWLAVQTSGLRVTALIPHMPEDELAAVVRSSAGDGARYLVSEPTLKELYLALGHTMPPSIG